jgi:hypothetical protein
MTAYDISDNQFVREALRLAPLTYSRRLSPAVHFVRVETRKYFDLTDPDDRAWEVCCFQRCQGGSGLSENLRSRIGQ